LHQSLLDAKAPRMKPESNSTRDIEKRKNATLHDVAAQAGVSLTTAAGVLRNAPGLRTSIATRQRVLEVSRQLGYRRNAVAASLKAGKTRLIGVLLPMREAPSTPHSFRAYPKDLLVAVLHAATRVGLRMIPLSLPGADEEPLLSSVTDRQLDGLIVGAIYNTALIDAIEAAGVPCVEMSGSGRYIVRPDNEGGAASAVEHLAALGHRRLVHWHTGAVSAAIQRSAGFEQAAQQLGLEARKVHTREELHQLLLAPADVRPTGIFTFNDYYASVALDVARDAGLRVPEDFSIVGFDDNIFAETSRPQLTTVHNPLDEQAEAAVSMLLTRLRGEEPPQNQVVVPTRLVVRQSTAVAPTAAPAQGIN
jgi:LacI family transcriptional regulator